MPTGTQTLTLIAELVHVPETEVCQLLKLGQQAEALWLACLGLEMPVSKDRQVLQGRLHVGDFGQNVTRPPAPQALEPLHAQHVLQEGRSQHALEHLACCQSAFASIRERL